MNMAWERLILLSLVKETTKFSPNTWDAGYCCTVVPAVFYESTFLGHPVAHVLAERTWKRVRAMAKPTMDYMHINWSFKCMDTIKTSMSLPRYSFIFKIAEVNYHDKEFWARETLARKAKDGLNLNSLH